MLKQLVVIFKEKYPHLKMRYRTNLPLPFINIQCHNAELTIYEHYIWVHDPFTQTLDIIKIAPNDPNYLNEIDILINRC